MSEKYREEYEVVFSPLLVMEEASRCLLCLDAPFSSSCPAGTDPAKFIRSLRFKNVKGAAETVRINNILGAICARVCPTERYCQAGCSRSGIDKPIEIGLIQRYITDFEDALKMDILEVKESNGKKVAVVGSGPAGLTVAAELAKDGYQVTIYEKEAKAGGYAGYTCTCNFQDNSGRKEARAKLQALTDGDEAKKERLFASMRNIQPLYLP